MKYQALAAGQVDVIDGYSTDGLIARYDLTVLRDDRHFFPPYEAAPLVSARLARPSPRHRRARGARRPARRPRMRALNGRVEVKGEPVAGVARDALAQLGLVGAVAPSTKTSPGESRTSLVDYLVDQRSTIARLALRHIELVAGSLLLAVLLAVPLGLALERAPGSGIGHPRRRRSTDAPRHRAARVHDSAVRHRRRAGARGAVLYSLYPIMRNTFTGVRDADPAAVASAPALGMTDTQILRDVRLPLAAPIIMAGIRTAAVVDVGTATLAAFIGAGGLGEPIVAGLALSDTRMILSGAIPAALLALAVDAMLAGVERLIKPGGLA